MIFFDCEWCVATVELACVQWARDNGPITITHGRDPGLRDLVLGWLRAGEHLVGLWTHFDTEIVARATGLESEMRAHYRARKVGDVAIREGLIDNARPGRSVYRPMSTAGKHEGADMVSAKWIRIVVKPRIDREGRETLKRLKSRSMAAIAADRLGVDLKAAKAADSVRMRYGELLDVPVAEWPAEFIQYAKADVEHTRGCWQSQAAEIAGRCPYEDFHHVDWHGALTTEDPALLAHEAFRVRYAYLAYTHLRHGLKVDEEWVATKIEQYTRLRDVAAQCLIDAGLAGPKAKGSKSKAWYSKKTKKIAALAVAAYLESDVPPGLTNKGLECVSDLEGLPLREWPEDAHKYVSSGTAYVRWLIDTPTDDARALLWDLHKAIEWPAERIRAALAACSHPELAANCVASKAHSYVTTFFEPLRDCDGAAVPRLNPLLDTGRSSFSGPIRQNCPQQGGIRESLVPRPGHVFVVLDYSQLEIFGFSCGVSAARHDAGYPDGGPLDAALREGRDTHTQLSLTILREQTLETTYEIAKHVKKHGKHPTLTPEQCKTVRAARDTGKRANFGFGSNMAPKTYVRTQLRQGNVVSVGEATASKAAWADAWKPETYFDAVGALDKEMRHSGISVQIEPPTGNWDDRFVRGGLTYTKTANTYFQSRCALGFCHAFCMVAEACADPGSPLHGSRVALLIHDEIVAEVPEDKAITAKAELARLMQAGMHEALGYVVPVEGEILRDRWRKC